MTTPQRPENPSTFLATVRELYKRPSPIILTVLAVGLLAIRLFMGNFSAHDLIAPLAILVIWPFLEWLIHVNILHFRPRTILGRKIDLTVARSHREHHEDPSDLSDITINIEVFPIVVPIIIALAYWLFPSPELATGALAMFFLMSWHYEWCHFVSHVRWVPPIEYYRRRQRLHRLHHHRDEKLWWGVSMGMADRIIGTAPEPSEVARSQTVNNIHGLK